MNVGLNRFVFPTPFEILPEILVLGDNSSISGTSIKRTIYCLRPRERCIEVLPQDWFNSGTLILGINGSPRWFAIQTRAGLSVPVSG
jgi:hypothetical protein